MSSAGGRVRATDEISKVEMEMVERPPEEPGRVGSKRVRDSLGGKGSHDGTSKVGDRYLHGTHGEQTLPDCNTLRSSISSPGENLRNKIERPTKICALYAQGSEEGSQVPQFKDSDGSTKDKLYRSLIHVYGETDKIMHGADEQSTFTPGVSQRMPSRFDNTVTKKLTTPINQPVPSPVVYEKNQEPSMGCHSGLTAETYLNSRGTFSRLLDGGILQLAADKGTYLGVNYSDSKLQYRPFDLSIPSDSCQRNEKLSAYSGTERNPPITPHKEHLSSLAQYSSSLPDFRNPLNAISDHSFGSPTRRAISHLGKLSQHLSSPVTKKVGPHKYVDAGTGTSRPAFLASTPEPSIVSPESLSPIKDEV
ncbi:hypothetical protein PR202_gb01695 [Eleusine coracana subsp. coracana]|uniref:Uncharacterized protein n=1 Tax=Eleusine coracana subsp. coracana TaxID=191504 RepID=A0AAV5DY27_ELECO|nr:hypothetical protein PR202_gb01695 [Eleusine coracana subsp. coracana]